jgi:acetate kinase
MRELIDNPNPEARLAVDYFVYQAATQIGAMAATLGGVDAIVFTAGIGEHSLEIRRRICESSAWLGVTLDAAANAKHGPRISTTDSRVSAWVIPTNEELMIAQHMSALLGIAGPRA